MFLFDGEIATMMTLLIKAVSIENAYAFAKTNGIDLVSASQLHESEVMAKADPKYRNKAIVWLCKCHGKAPFPRGTLLWHS